MDAFGRLYLVVHRLGLVPCCKQLLTLDQVPFVIIKCPRSYVHTVLSPFLYDSCYPIIVSLIAVGDNRLYWQIEESDMLVDVCVKDSLSNGLCWSEYRLIERAIDNSIYLDREVG